VYVTNFAYNRQPTDNNITGRHQAGSRASSRRGQSATIDARCVDCSEKYGGEALTGK